MSVGLFFFSMLKAYHDHSSIARENNFKLTHYPHIAWQEFRKSIFFFEDPP
jgi:hypothetical protein